MDKTQENGDIFTIPQMNLQRCSTKKLKINRAKRRWQRVMTTKIPQKTPTRKGHEEEME